MKIYDRSVRIIFSVIFVLGGISHVVLGRTIPEDYAGFGTTALFPVLEDLWSSLVMPNIGWMTLALAAYEIACGIGILFRRTRIWAIYGMLLFLVFVTVLGYGMEVGSSIEDFATNRLATIIMALLLLPLVLTSTRERMRDVRARNQ
ncbi:hypothetical protein ACFSYH_06265 [Populibacterium corticicola]|uniref:DoxX family membrane protein n=1 Tax=Populibacterium corticicola TaxID=1812826 RepID=A0ABW5XCI7_9MICO